MPDGSTATHDTVRHTVDHAINTPAVKQIEVGKQSLKQYHLYDNILIKFVIPMVLSFIVGNLQRRGGL